MELEHQQASRNDGEVDRLSSLPDDILTVILSLLPVESAVASGLLSKRWYGLWTFITTFSFVESTGKTSNASSIINHVLPQLLSPQIQTFVLHLHTQLPESRYSLRDPSSDHEAYLETLGTDIASWITFFCLRRVRKIEVRYDSAFNTELTASLPSCLFRSQSLEYLFLGIHFEVTTLPDEFSLPSLKNLYMYLLDDSHRTMLGKMLKSCSRLEVIALSGVFGFGFDDEVSRRFLMAISTPNLESLFIQIWNWMCDAGGIIIDVDAPNLKVFDASDVSHVKLRFVKEPSLLQDARLTYCEGRMSRGVELFRAIRSARVLKLCSTVIDALDGLDADIQLPIFHNLINLDLETTSPACWKTFLRFLSYTPNLEFLTIDMSLFDEESEETGLIPLDTPPPSSLQRVKGIKIGFRGIEDNETMELTKYLLSNASNLKRLFVEFPIITSETICEELRLGKELELHENLNKLPRSSMSCHIIVNVHQIEDLPLFLF